MLQKNASCIYRALLRGKVQWSKAQPILGIWWITGLDSVCHCINIVFERGVVQRHAAVTVSIH